MCVWTSGIPRLASRHAKHFQVCTCQAPATFPQLEDMRQEVAAFRASVPYMEHECNALCRQHGGGVHKCHDAVRNVLAKWAQNLAKPTPKTKTFLGEGTRAWLPSTLVAVPTPIQFHFTVTEPGIVVPWYGIVVMRLGHSWQVERKHELLRNTSS